MWRHACSLATHTGQALRNADLEVLDKILGIFAQLTIEDGFTTSLQQQQLIKGLKDVNTGLVNSAHNCPACVDNVAHGTHHNGSSSGIQACRRASRVNKHPTLRLTPQDASAAKKQPMEKPSNTARKGC